MKPAPLPRLDMVRLVADLGGAAKIAATLRSAGFSCGDRTPAKWRERGVISMARWLQVLAGIAAVGGEAPRLTDYIINEGT